MKIIKEGTMKELIGVTFHFKDGSTQKMPVSALIRGGNNSSGRQPYEWIDEHECPEHGRWQWVPPGNRKSDGTPYKGFWTCSDRDCLKRPGRDFTDNINPDDYMAESANDNSMDALPF